MWEESSGNVSNIRFFSNNGISLILVSLLFLLKTKAQFFSHPWHTAGVQCFSKLQTKSQTATAEMKPNPKSHYQSNSHHGKLKRIFNCYKYYFHRTFLHRIYCFIAWVNIVDCIAQQFPFFKLMKLWWICFPAFATMYAEYKFVERVHERTGAVSPHLNKASFAVGIISCVGMCLVATFQVCLV